MSFLLFLSLTLSAAPQELTLQDALKQSLERNENLRESSSEIREHEAKLSETRGAIFPTLKAVATSYARQRPTTFLGFTSPTINGVSQNTEDYRAYLEGEQVLYSGGSLTSNLSSIKSKIEKARQEYFATKQMVAKEAVTSFLELMRAQDQVKAALENLNILKNYVDVTTRYERIGRSRHVDRIRAQVNYSTGKTDLEKSKNTEEKNQIALKRLMGVISPEPFVPKHKIVLYKADPINIDDALRAALKNNPDYITTTLNTEIVDYEKGIDLSDDMPKLKLKGQWGYQGADRPTWFKDTSRFYEVGLELTIPLFSGLSSLSKRQYFGEQKYQAEKKQIGKQIELREALEKSMSDLKSREELLKITQEAVTEARKGLDLANRGYKQGTVPSSDVIDLQKTRFDAEKAFIDSKYDYLLALLELRWHMGIDIEKAYD